MNRSLPLALKWVAIGLALGLLVWMAGIVASHGYLVPVLGIAFLGLVILAVYGTKRGIPAKYLLPGIVFMLAFRSGRSPSLSPPRSRTTVTDIRSARRSRSRP